ncbi:hypothetical protein XNC1_2860 [Xenorhabdus nematophila ATCC 19061]|uniref:Uncharacterized protein n=1 Tax=Xenorhabdus nematophila (strain ATCC 19061 / DSM 3370 / CCUG 14189 / LMG 1036 / NCIMB 9965 / AN6) TaxID=406817 RepID=D3VJ57_XENNA|nr:hypothetical protein XNC1_2860 [Xenorhabdus nematophila ATCC 19061]
MSAGYTYIFLLLFLIHLQKQLVVSFFLNCIWLKTSSKFIIYFNMIYIV